MKRSFTAFALLIITAVGCAYIYSVRALYLPGILVLRQPETTLNHARKMTINSEIVTTKTTAATTASQNGCKTSLRNSQSEWFKSRFKDINPFWTSENILPDQESLKWWLTIQRSKSENINDILNNLYKIGVPSKLTYYQKNSSCRTCAVVGNSYILKDSKHGSDIDKNDIVIRFNKAKITGFEDDVGKKTTYRVLYPESAIPKIENGLLLLPFKPLDIQWLTSALTVGNITRTYTRVLSKIDCNKENIKVIHPSFMSYCYKNWVEKHGRYPSTGILGVILAMEICDEVNIFGFGASETGAWTHYWEPPKGIDGAFRKTNVHNGDFEKDLLLKLHDTGIIKKYT